jgi:general secretion pathway protein D
VLNEIFTGASNASTGLDAPLNQLAPGSGAVITSSGRTGTQLAQAASPLGAANAGQALPATPTSFDTRFADAAGGRFASASSFGSARGASSGANSPLLPSVRIVPDIVNNALLIYANQENYRLIEKTLQQLDLPQLQVAIDATIAEVTLNDQLQYGVQFFLKSKDVGLPTDTGSIMNNLVPNGGAVLSRLLPGFNFLVGTEAQPRLILDALHAVTDVKIMSTPSVVVLDNGVASLQVGDQIPITTRTAQSVDVPTAPVVNNIDYRNTGVILRVAPRINANGNVLLDVEQEISAVANTPTATSLTPTVSQRKVKSSIAVASGQTVLLGGLISERQDRGRNGIPVLDQVPGLSELLSRNTGSMQRTELIIFIRPQIIRGSLDAARVAQELRAKMRGGFGNEASPGCGRACPAIPATPRAQVKK